MLYILRQTHELLWPVLAFCHTWFIEMRIGFIFQDPRAKLFLYIMMVVILLIGTALYLFWSLWKYVPDPLSDPPGVDAWETSCYGNTHLIPTSTGDTFLSGAVPVWNDNCVLSTYVETLDFTAR